MKDLVANNFFAGFPDHAFCGANGRVVVWTDISPFLFFMVDTGQSRPRKSGGRSIGSPKN